MRTVDPSAQPGDENPLRAFVAIEIGEDVRRALGDLQERARRSGARVGWVAPQNIHLTVLFLGDIFPPQARGLAGALDEMAASLPSFECEAAGTGFFGSARSPRVLWAGVRGAEAELADVHARSRVAASRLGIRTEDRAFAPHLTLGRVRSGQRVGELTSAWASATNTRFGLVRVERLLLMQSHLEHQGVRYSILHASALKGA